MNAPLDMSWAGLTFAPLLPGWALWALGCALVGLLALGLWRRSPGAILRFGAGLAALAALAGPSLLREQRSPKADVAALILDETDSDRIDGRDKRLAAAEAAIRADIERLKAVKPLELRVIRVDSKPGPQGEDKGSPLFGALASALADVDAARLAGAIVVSDGRAHDAAPPNFPAPVHFLSTGRADEYDRRIVLESAPTFAVARESIDIRLRVEDLGKPPTRPGAPVGVTVRIDGEDVVRQTLALGESQTIRAPINRAGQIVVEVQAEPLAGQLTERNDRAVFSLRAARDRLRVLLVSGVPHAGERTWRNLLKADPAVDLVHFTILRSPDKDPQADTSELSLIPFPTHELFVVKLKEFDLVIFDRYAERNMLSTAYIANVADYVRAGGAALVAAGPEFAGVDSLERSPLGEILPASPTGRLLEGAFRPRLTALGMRHPVTADLARGYPPPEKDGDPPGWGSWLRVAQIVPREGAEIAMETPDGEPLLALDHVGEGRVALLASDTIWLWSRGYEGGGPQAELLRRIAHWLMKEPELEEEALMAETAGGKLSVTRRTLAEKGPESARAIAPSGAEIKAPFAAAGPGLWRAEIETPEQGLHRIDDGEMTTLASVGPSSPLEFVNPAATDEAFGPLAAATGGASLRLTEGIPSVRRVSEGRTAFGRGWIGLQERNASALVQAWLTPLLPPWAALLIAGGLLVAAWRREGR